jgi:hypothetical protein
MEILQGLEKHKDDVRLCSLVREAIDLYLKVFDQYK